MLFGRLKPYLYSLDIEDYNYQKGFELFKDFELKTGMCSSIRKGNIAARNYDWTYDENVDVIVRTRHYKNRYATIGVAHTIGNILTEPNLINALQGSKDLSELYSLIPFMTTDCINEKHVFCSINVVPAGDKSSTTPIGTTGERICQIMLPRFICDFADSADKAMELLQNNIIFAPLAKVHNECHLLISDTNKTYVVEFVEGEIKTIEANYITNFYLDGWDGSIASKALGNTDNEIEATGLTDHAMGLERYKIIEDSYGNIEGFSGMLGLLESLKYTNAYSEEMNPLWYSEFYGETQTFGDLTIYSTVEEMEPIMQYAREHYIPGVRDGQSWNTAHTSMYEIDDCRLTLFSQEDFEHPIMFDINTRPLYGIIDIEELYPNPKLI